MLAKKRNGVGRGRSWEDEGGKILLFLVSFPPQPITLNLHSEKRLVEKIIVEKLRVNKFIFNNHLLVPSLHLV